MLHAAQFVAVFCCTVFAGAALYINLVEPPARMNCDTKTAVTVWAPSYKRATMMQAPLAILSFSAGGVRLVARWRHYVGYWGSAYWLGRAIHISCNHANEPSTSDSRT